MHRLFGFPLPALRTVLRPGATSAFTASVLAALALVACKSGESAEPPPNTPAASASAEAAETAPAEGSAAADEPAASGSIHALTLNSLEGEPTPLSQYAGKTLLVVNTASECGYTPQYEGLQKLHAKYSEQGFAVLGFPSNDFGGQEPGTAKEIATFCTSVYGVNFPMFEKLKTKGPEQSPLYALLSESHGEPKWNFHKYLVNKEGKPVQAWPSAVEPSSPEIAAAIERELHAN